VKVTIPAQTIEVDETAWRNEYGPNAETARELREDIKSYFKDLIAGSYPVEVGIVQVVR
jgi:hypothetical protein